MYSKRDIFLLRVVHWIFKVIGLAPCNVTVIPSNHRKNDKQVIVIFSNSIPGTIYNVILLLLALVRIYFVSRDLFIHNVDLPGGHDDLQKSLVLFKYVTSALIISFYGIYHKSIMTMVNDIFRLERELDQTLAHFEQINGRKWWLVIPFIIHICALCLAIVNECLWEGSDFMFYTMERLSGFLLKSLIMQYAILINLLRKIFFSLNKSLYLMGNADIELQYHSLVITSVQHEERLIQNIRLIARAQRNLNDTCQELARYYSMLILITNAFLCGSLIHDSYKMVLIIILSLPLSFAVHTVILTAGYAFPIVVLSLSVTGIITETKSTSLIVHQLMATLKAHTRIHYELEQLSLELLHRKISFTACELFPLDNTFLVATLSTIITYLLILVQYDQAQSAENKNYWNKTAQSISNPDNDKDLNITGE